MPERKLGPLPGDRGHMLPAREELLISAAESRRPASPAAHER